MKKIIFAILFLIIYSETNCQVRPNKFYDYSNPSRWQRNIDGGVEIQKDGYRYDNAEFRLSDLPDADALIIYSITEDITFICPNFHSVPVNIPIKIKLPSGAYILYPNTVYYAKADGTFWVFDKGKNITGKLNDSGICFYNCSGQQQYFRYIGDNGNSYAIKAIVSSGGSGASVQIQMPKEELVSIQTW